MLMVKVKQVCQVAGRSSRFILMPNADHIHPLFSKSDDVSATLKIRASVPYVGIFFGSAKAESTKHNRKRLSKGNTIAFIDTLARGPH
jgi:hypothetical protein